MVSPAPNSNWRPRKRRGPWPGVPLVTIMTDIADYPPHFWNQRQEQHFICGTDKAVEQAQAMGHAPEHVHRVSGMILNPRFYEIPAIGTGSSRRRGRTWASMRSFRSAWCCSAARARR